MSPYLGYTIAIGILAVIVFFSGRVVIRNIRSQLKGESTCSGCGGGCSCDGCHSTEEVAKEIEDKFNQ